MCPFLKTERSKLVNILASYQNGEFLLEAFINLIISQKKIY